MLSQTAIYSLQAMLRLAEAEGEGPVRVEDIARVLDVPRNYLSKILHALARDGLLTSTRGPGGGFRLSKPATEIRLAEVVRQEGVPSESGCLLGRERCSDDDPCPAHHRWKDVSRAVREFFDQTSLADLSKDGLPLPHATTR